jgi:polyisoprenyl-phosphate glycosyltransferase
VGVLNPLPLISVGVPCYNEAAVIRETHRRLSEVAARLSDARFEFIYVDDGSGDETPNTIHELCSDQRVRGILLSRSFGHQIATTAGLESASGNMNRLSRVQLPLDTGDFRLLDRAVVDALLPRPERDRFLRGMVSWVGSARSPCRTSATRATLARANTRC